MENKTRLEGREAIAYAEKNGLSLSKYADPIEDGRNDVTVAEANAIVREDPSLVYVEVL